MTQPPAADGGSESVTDILSSLQAELREARQLLDATQRALSRGEDRMQRALGIALSYTGWRDTASPQVDGLIIGFARIGGCCLAPVEMAPTRPGGDSPVRMITQPPPGIRLVARCLGPFLLQVNDRPVERWQRRKAKSLCQFLIVHRERPVPREVLMELLWPEASPETASGRLKVTVHALRQIVNSCGSPGGAADCIVFEDGLYRVNPRLHVWVDAEEFQRHWEAGRACELHRDLPAAAAAFEQAEALYRGDFLQEDLYEEWVQLPREHLKDIFLGVLTKLADHYLASGDYDECIERCHRILARDSTREDAYRRLMLCHGRRGHVGQALSWYRLCAEVLQRELELPPGPETESLYHLLRAGRAV